MLELIETQVTINFRTKNENEGITTSELCRIERFVRNFGHYFTFHYRENGWFYIWTYNMEEYDVKWADQIVSKIQEICVAELEIKREECLERMDWDSLMNPRSTLQQEEINKLLNGE